MAKKLNLDDPFRKTSQEEPPAPGQPAPVDNSDLDAGRIISSGVGITEGELKAMDTLAKQYRSTRNSLMHMAIRQFLERVRAGEFDPGDQLQEPAEPPKRRYVRRR
jgi:hypothetical protein